MRPIPPDYNGAAEAVLMLLGDGDAAKYLRRQLELRDRISALTKTKEQLEASTKPGALDGLRLWWLRNQLHHAQTSAQLQPDSFEQRDFNGCSRLPLLIDEAKNLDTAEQVLFGMGLRLAMRDMSLKLRWGSYQADLDGYRANAILVVEDLSDVGRRIKESERNYGYDFNRAKLGAHLFSYFLDLSVVREFAGQALELACAENDKADTAAIAGRIKAIFDSPEAVPSRTAELDSLYEDFDRAVLGEQFGSELDVVRTRMRRRLTLDYGLSAQEELLTPTALPFLRGMAAGLDIQFSEAFPALFNYWFGTSTHPLDHTPEADSFGDVTVANYVLSVNCPDPSSWDTVRRKLLDLIEAGALPKALAGQVGAKATDKDAAGLRCNAAQPVNLDGNYIKEALPSLEESLTRRLLNASGTRSDREKHTKALESLSELGVSIRIGLRLELADQKAKAA